jgi:hypothetical protein|tara:strand:+ start:10350 stop:10601 length:252 start_codon:yes stop_codon:yes gene_type:complete
MTSLLNNKGLNKGELAVAVEMEITHELEEVRKSITSEKESVDEVSTDGNRGVVLRLATLRGRESALVRILNFMSMNLKKEGKK